MDTTIETVNSHENDVLSGSFKWMAAGLFVSGIVSIVVALTPSLVSFIFASQFGFIAILLVQLGIVIYLSRMITSMSAETAKVLFMVYAVISGTTLSVIFMAFATSSIISIFFGAAAMFAALAFYGARTKKDLTKIGQVARFALIGFVIAMLVTLFVGGALIDLILSWIGVVIFTALIMYDAQKLKQYALEAHTPEEVAKAKILGGLRLYLDFINLFLNLLRIFGRRR